mgnify:FL=1
MAKTENSHIQMFEQYLQNERRYSSNTSLAYITDLAQFYSFTSANYQTTDPAMFNTNMVRSWLVLLKSEQVSAKSINRKISSLRSFFKFLMRKNILTTNVAAGIHNPKIPKRLPVFAEEQQLHTLVHEVEFSDTWAGKTDKLIIELLYATGMRRNELITLVESQVDLSNCQIKILGKGNKERIVPISPVLMQQIQEYISEKRKTFDHVAQLLITPKGKKLYPKYVHNIVTKNLALVTTLQKKSPHILRHSFATHLMNNGADLNAVKDLLGHSSLASTQVYVHNTIKKLKDVHKQAHPKG